MGGHGKRKAASRFTVGVVLALLGFADAAQARWSVDIAPGGMVGLSDIDVDDDGNVRSGGWFAAGGAYGLGDYFDVTGRLQGGFADIDSSDSWENLSGFAMTFGGRLYILPPHRVRPWLGTEIGWYRMRVLEGELFDDDDSDKTDNTFGLNAGGGVDVAVNPVVSLGIDVRYNNAFWAFDGVEFLTALFKVGIHFGADRADRYIAH